MYQWQHIFGDLGKLVKVDGNVADYLDVLDARISEVEGHFDDDLSDIEYANFLIATLVSMTTGATAGRTSMRTECSRYMNSILKTALEITYNTDDNIILDLIRKMVRESQTIRGNLVTIMPEWTESGDTHNQLSGYDNIRGLDNSNLDASMILYISIDQDSSGDYSVSFYNDSAMGSGDLIGHTAAYNTPGIKTIIPDNASGLRGTITIDAVAGADWNIQIQYAWQGDRTGNGLVTAWSASQMAQDDDVIIKCINASVSGSEQWRIQTRLRGVISGSNGLITTGVAFPSATQRDYTGVNILIADGATDFEVDDTFEFRTLVTEQGLFQTFFRRNYDRILENVLDGTETISDSLAG